MVCGKCGSENVTCQAVAETNIARKRHGIIWWICVGWWWLPLKWLVFTVPAIIVKIFAPKKYKTTTRHRTRAVCQNCGHSWFID